MTGVGGSPLGPQARVALTVGARREGATAELRRAAAGADGAVSRQKPATDCKAKAKSLIMGVGGEREGVQV